MTVCGYNRRYLKFTFLCLFSRAPSSELSALIEKLQKTADKVEKNIYDVEQNLNKVQSDNKVCYLLILKCIICQFN